ncbi:MAG TPA: AAA family ATPase [Polyangiales bacterium]|nr:AAA family ATPase [Polyangiales bacterium]
MLLVFDHYTFDEGKRELRRDAELVRIDPQQFDLLALFVRHPGQLLSRQQIIESVWEGRAIADSGLSVAVAKLRKVLGKPHDGHDYIESRYGRGYRFLAQVKQMKPLAGAERPANVQLAIVHNTSDNTPLVGRADAFDQLRSSAEHALAGRGRLCLLVGEPGIGKTRLAESIAQSVQGQGSALVLWARCQAEATTPLWPVRQIVRELIKLGLVDAALLQASEPQRAELPGSFDAASAQLFGALKSDGSIDHGTLDALAQCVIEASQRRPLMLMIDDIQWADSASLRVLTYITDEIPRSPILLVCGLRYAGSELSGQREVSRLWNHRNCQRIELRRLSAQDVTEYVHARFGSDSQWSELSRELFTRSEGNPFFMVDLLRALDPAASNSSQALRPSRLALDSVRERLQDLTEQTRRVLSAAAVIGHDFDIGLLSHVTNSKPEVILDVLTAPRVDQTVVPMAGAPGAFSFVHELVREVLYNELGPHERGQLHLRAGEGLQLRLENGGEATNAQLAHHFLCAQPHGEIEVAVAYTQSAAAEASRLAAHTDALGILHRGLEVLRFHVAPRPEMRAGLLLQLAMVERVAGDPNYRAHLATATSIAREHRLGRLLTAAGQLLSVSPDLVAHAEASSVLEAADATLDADDYENLAIVRAHMAWTPPNCHSARRVMQLIDQAQAFAEKTTSASARAAVDDARLYFSAGPDSLERAEEIALHIERACVLHPEIASQARRILVERSRLIIAMQRGDQAAMGRAIEVRAALLSRLKNAELTWHHERMLLVKAMNEGAFLQVKSDLIALRERARRLELHASQLLWSLDYGVFLCRTSDVNALAARVRPALHANEHDSPQTRASKIRSLVEFGLYDDVAHAMAEISIAAIEDLPKDRDYLAVLCHLAVGAAAANSAAHCRALARLLAPYSAFYAVGISFHCEGSIASHLGLLFEALGELDRAREHFALGFEREQSFGLMPRAALTGFRLAKLLLREPGDNADALRLLAHVHEEAERMGMLPLAMTAHELRETARRTGVSTPSALTARSRSM